jgi:hypothetical protein
MNMDVGAKRDLVTALNYCELCLRHPKSPNSSCGITKKASSPPPCGEDCCPALHLPELHVRRSGWVGIHGAVFTTPRRSMVEQHTVTEEDKEEKLNKLNKEHEPPPEREQQPEMVENKDLIKDVGDMHVRGPSAYSSGDTFVKTGEVIPIYTSGCAAPALEEIAPIENSVLIENEIQIENENAQSSDNDTLFDTFEQSSTQIPWYL